MGRASNARSGQQIAHAYPDFGSLLLRSLQVVTERASNARSIQQITHAFPDFGSLPQIWAVLRGNMERASNARHIQQLAHAFPDFGTLLQRSLQVVIGESIPVQVRPTPSRRVNPRAPRSKRWAAVPRRMASYNKKQ